MVESVGVVAVLGLGAMGSAVAGRMVASGVDVVSVFEGRSAASRKRAEAAGVRAGTWSDLENADVPKAPDSVIRFEEHPELGEVRAVVLDGMGREAATMLQVFEKRQNVPVHRNPLWFDPCRDFHSPTHGSMLAGGCHRLL